MEVNDKDLELSIRALFERSFETMKEMEKADGFCNWGAVVLGAMDIAATLIGTKAAAMILNGVDKKEVNSFMTEHFDAFVTKVRRSVVTSAVLFKAEEAINPFAKFGDDEGAHV